MTTRTDAEQQGFVHSALLYQSQGEYLDFVLRFVVDGLAAGEPVLIAVPGENLALLRNALRRECDGIPAGLHTADITEIRPQPEPVSGDKEPLRRAIPRSTGAHRQPTRLAGPHR
jgi:hypothetical protein